LSLAREHNFEVNVLISCDDHPQTSEYGSNINLFFIKKRGSTVSSLNYIFLLYKKLRQIGSDIVIFVTLEQSFFGSIISTIAKHKTVFLISGLGTKVNKSNLPISSFLYAWLKDLCFYFEGIKKNKSHFIFQNSTDLNFFIKRYKLHLNNCMVIKGNGIDMSKFFYIERTFEEYNICYAGRASDEKGTDTLIKAFSILVAKEYPVGNLNLCLLDEKISKKYLEEIKDKTNTHIFKKIKVAYNLSHEKLVEIFHASSLFILPSNREGLSKAALEAASTGLPLITSDAPGAVDCILENFNGLSFRFGNHNELIQRIISLADKEVLKKFSINSRDFVLKEAELRIISKEYALFLNKI